MVHGHLSLNRLARNKFHSSSGEEEEGAEIDEDTLMEYRIKAKGVIQAGRIDYDEKNPSAPLDMFRSKKVELPSLCKQTLQPKDLASLLAKCQVYIDIWNKLETDGLSDVSSCEESTAEELKKLAIIEGGPKPEGGEEGEEEEGGDECDKAGGEEGEEEEEDAGYEYPMADAPKLACFYYVVNRNLDVQSGTLPAADALNPELSEGILKAVTRGLPERTKVSWLEFWLY